MHAAHRSGCTGFVEEGEKEGAKLLLGGTAPAGPHAAGAFVAPTVFDDVPADMGIAQKEVFGPVLDVLAFSTLRRGDLDGELGVEYGLAGSVWTHDVRTALKCARRTRSGSGTSG